MLKKILNKYPLFPIASLLLGWVIVSVLDGKDDFTGYCIIAFMIFDLMNILTQIIYVIAKIKILLADKKKLRHIFGGLALTIILAICSLFSNLMILVLLSGGV